MRRLATFAMWPPTLLVLVLYCCGQQGSQDSDVPRRASFDSAGPFSGGLAAVQREGKWGYIDNTGKMVIVPQFEHAHRFSEGLAGVSVKGKYGFIHRDGSWAVKPQFDQVQAFAEGMAAAAVDKKWGFLRTSGEFLITPRYSFAWSFSEGLAVVRLDRKWGYIDRSGNISVKPEFEVSCPFSQGLAAVMVGRKYGFIDKSGAMVIKPQFEADGCPVFSEEKAAVAIAGEGMGYVDRRGTMVIPAKFVCAGRFHDGLAAAGIAGRCNSHNLYAFDEVGGQLGFYGASQDPHLDRYSGARFGFINDSGTMAVFSTQFTSVRAHFTEGLAAVEIDKEWGFVDRAGKFVVKPQFEEATAFSEGFAAVKLGSWGFIDKTGHWLTVSSPAAPK